MRVRTKFVLILLSLTLVPLITAGVIAYQIAERALRESLGSSFQRMAAEAMDKVDRTLRDVHQDVQIWAGSEIMQEVVTGDLDGRISSFLMTISKEHGDFADIFAIDSQGDVVASSDAVMIGRNLTADGAFRTAMAGTPVVRDIQESVFTGTWVVSFYWPIRAQFDESLTVGVICANWNAAELSRMTQTFQPSNDRQTNPRVILMRAEGFAIYVPPSKPPPLFEGNLIQSGWQAALFASRGETGYVIEEDKGTEGYLIGYSHSRGYRDFSGLGWSVLIVEDLETAFAPIEQLELIMLAIGAFAVLVVGCLSLVISHKVASPLVRMADVAKGVAAGDFEGRVGYRSGDEIGTLASVFDGMIGELKNQRALLVEDIVERERVEKALREAKEAAEESTTRFGAVLNTMGEGIITTDSSGIIIMVNQEVENTWGYSQQELLGQSVEMLMSTPLRPQHQLGLAKYLQAWSPSKQRLQSEGLRKDGSTFPLEITVSTTRIGERLLLTAAVHDITERKRAEEQIKASLAEKEALLKEIHHRVKNNLQVIVSLLNLQSSHIRDQKAYAIFKDSESRIKSMALIHERLYGSKDLSRIDAADYITALTGDLLHTYGLGSKIAMNVKVEHIVLGMDTAIHCGLLVNELVSNALKHAFPDEREGEVGVDLREVATGRYALVVADNGVGLPTDLNLRNSETLGVQLVWTLVDHLEGTLDVSRQNGTEFTIQFRDIDE